MTIEELSTAVDGIGRLWPSAFARAAVRAYERARAALPSVLRRAGYRWGTAHADELLGVTLRGIAVLDAAKARWSSPGRYRGWHRAVSLYERVETAWRTRRAVRANEREARAAAVAWWEQRRGDYAGAYARVAARAGARV
jgi:hypothetical protein